LVPGWSWWRWYRWQRRIHLWQVPTVVGPEDVVVPHSRILVAVPVVHVRVDAVNVARGLVPFRVKKYDYNADAEVCIARTPNLAKILGL
jgi:hypothetical protein